MSRHRSLFVCLCVGLTGGALVFSLAAAPPDPPRHKPEAEGTDEEEIAPQVDIGAMATAPPPAQTPTIQAASLPEKPAPGMGRLRIDVGGSRRWCTFPDDRVVKPPVKPNAPAARNPVYTFGYIFTVAAVNRARPAETLMLFESPVFRTAVLRQAAKLGHSQAAPSNRAPAIGEMPERVQAPKKEDPSALVPYWQEAYRCTSLPEGFDFDLAPGTYDFYLAFDILLKSGNWTHRSIAFATDVTIDAGRATKLQATAGMQAGGRRELTVSGPVLEPVSTGAR